MPTATQNDACETVFARQSRSKFECLSEDALKRAGGGLDEECPVARLANLLTEDPVDLARVSDEIRAEPALADVIRGIAAVLHLSPDSSVSSVEEATILLGVDRLRVISEAFPAFVRLHKDTLVRTVAGEIHFEAAEGESRSPKAGHRAPERAETPESLYLASFVRLLRLDDAGLEGGSCGESHWGSLGASPSSIAEMTEILVRDVLSFVPRLNQAKT